MNTSQQPRIVTILCLTNSKELFILFYVYVYATEYMYVYHMRAGVHKDQEEGICCHGAGNIGDSKASARADSSSLQGHYTILSTNPCFRLPPMLVLPCMLCP